MDRLIERGLFASRWLLAPMYIGLVGALMVLLYVFFLELVEFARSAPTLSETSVILGLLSLIDLTLAANLVLIVIFSGYENFISKIEPDDRADRLEWQGTVDFAGLKLKLVASIVAISGIHLLKTFMEMKSHQTTELMWMVIIHLTFVVSGVLMALMDLLSAHAKTAKGMHGK